MWLRILPGYLRLTSTQDPQLCSFSASSVPEVQLSQYGPALENLATLRLFQQISCLEASEEGNEHSSSSVALATETVSFPMLQESSPDSSSTPLEEKNEFEKHSVLYFMPEIRKECVIKLEWKSSPDPFIFGDFEFHTVKELQRILDSPGDHQDPRVGETFHYLDEANVRAMQFDKAEELCKKTLKIYRAHSEPVSLKKVVDRRFMIAGTTAEKIVGCLTEISAILESVDEPEEALKLLQKAMKLLEDKPGQQSTIAGIEARMGTVFSNHSETFSERSKLEPAAYAPLVASTLGQGKQKILDAKKVFDEMPHRNLVSWNAMIVGFLKNKLYNRAIGLFREILCHASLDPGKVTLSNVLSAYASLVDLDFGMQIHGNILKRGLIELVYVNNSLVDMYCKCGSFDGATKLFYAAGDRDVVTWNVMIEGCIHNENFEQACIYFRAMKREGIVPDGASYSSLLHASASIASLMQGTLIHNHVLKTGHMKNACVLLVSNHFLIVFSFFSWFSCCQVGIG